MNFFSGMSISASGMTAEQMRMEAASQNLSTLHVAHAPNAPPLPMERVLVTEQQGGLEGVPSSSREPRGVKAAFVGQPAPDRYEYDPHNPLANKDGFVAYPEVDVLGEMSELISASTSFDANVTAYTETKSMLQKALEIGKA